MVVANELLAAQAVDTALASGAYPSDLRTGYWQLRFTPDHNADSQTDDLMGLVLFYWGGGTQFWELLLYRDSPTSTLLVTNTHAGVTGSTTQLSYTAGQTLLLDIDMATGEIVLVGDTAALRYRYVTTVQPVIDVTATLRLGARGAATDVFEGTLGHISPGSVRVPEPVVAMSGYVGTAVTGTIAAVVPELVVNAVGAQNPPVTGTIAAVVTPIMQAFGTLHIPPALTVYSPDGTTYVDTEGTVDDDGAPRLSIDQIRNAIRLGKLLTHDDENL